jgi:three-Cys-motif partner protein
MSHRADSSFFEEKKDWSRRKDRILGSYLTAYLPAIATQKRPILIVDAFAGPGRFIDGEDGSPLLLAKAIEVASNRPSFTSAMLYCVERDEGNFERLQEALKPYSFALCRYGQFLGHLNEIESIARTHSTFLYVDPFTVEGIDWNVMNSVLARIKPVQSVEVLLNFNAASFVRRALAALSRSIPEIDPEKEDTGEIDAPFLQEPSIERLNRIVGDDRWISILNEQDGFSTQVEAIAHLMQLRFRENFREVGMHAIKALPHHTVPKYYLIFGSRSSKALLLMNDEMAKSRKTLASLAEPDHQTLFEMRPEELVPDTARLPDLIRRHSANKRARKDVIADVIREAFCEFTKAEIRGVVEQMLKSGDLQSETGKWRINDNTVIWRTPR